MADNFWIKKIWFLIIAVVIILVILIISWQLSARQPARKILTIGQAEITVEIADTENLRAQGLSGRKFLADNQGLLFVFPQPLRPAFWMKDMLFPLDLIWLKDNQVVGYEKNLLPAGENPPVLYRPSQDVNLVLEVNAGWVDEQGIKVGDELVVK